MLTQLSVLILWYSEHILAHQSYSAVTTIHPLSLVDLEGLNLELFQLNLIENTVCVTCLKFNPQKGHVSSKFKKKKKGLTLSHSNHLS